MGNERASDRAWLDANKRVKRPAGGNREDLREGTASALRLLAAGHRPRVHADPRRPVRGRGRAPDAGGGPGAGAAPPYAFSSERCFCNRFFCSPCIVGGKIPV